MSAICSESSVVGDVWCFVIGLKFCFLYCDDIGFVCVG